mmetsp:Transcript_82722/g.221828  ORF Transcript_82722/g.221828 Transcript_82722/m.221828 type:complete len:245 (-) Transcript_82722:167-901(-)
MQLNLELGGCVADGAVRSTSLGHSIWTTLHLLSMVVTIVCLSMALFFRSQWPFNYFSVFAWQCALVLNTGSSCCLILLYRLRDHDKNTHDREPDFESGMNEVSSESECLVDSSEIGGGKFQPSLFSARNVPIATAAVNIFVGVITTLLLVYWAFEHQLAKQMDLLVLARNVFVLCWFVSSLGDSWLVSNPLHSIFGIIIFAFYLLIDVHELAGNEDHIKRTILLTLDLCGLFLQSLRWTATSTR